MLNNKCKICRRLGVKLFLKGEKCSSPKCPMIRRPYPPGPKRKRRRKTFSEYGKELREKQKLRNFYNLRETQLRKYVKEILKKGGKTKDPTALLIEKLEARFDNVVFRLGFANSHIQARQLISHKHFLINGKPVNIPSYSLKKDDKISIKSQKREKAIFQKLPTLLKKKQLPSWLKIDKEKLEGEVIGVPLIEEVAPFAEISAIFEFYSR